MNNELPEYIETLLDEWESISYFAYDGFEKNGRGSVAVFNENNEISLGYCGIEYFIQNNKIQEVEIIEKYDPENEFIVTFEMEHGIRTIRIGTPENGRNPKGIWFFRTLEKINENPENTFDDLPEWFVEAVDRLMNLGK